MTNQTKSQFIAVASITSELSAVMVVAKEISLAAANAKAIAFRAGDKAKGFQPITDFINELAKETIELVTNINIYALVLYRLTVEEYHKTIAFNKFELAAKMAEGALYAESMQEPVDQARLAMQDCQRRFKKDVSQLLGQLEEVMHHARAA
ncbi:MAG: chemotaxis protein, partial [Methylobacter sp.]|nr:chemotaxis protein [Methylobacter sp.]